MVDHMGDGVNEKSFDALSDGVMLDRAVALAQLDPVDEDREYWEISHELRRRGSVSICDQALALADGDETLQRVAADILSQLGCLEGRPFKEAALAALAKMKPRQTQNSSTPSLWPWASNMTRRRCPEFCSFRS
jgi:hypothetical protein